MSRRKQLGSAILIVITVALWLLLAYSGGMSSQAREPGSVTVKKVHLADGKEPEKQPQLASASDDITVVVEKGPFVLSLTFRATFEAADNAPITVNPEAWKPDAGGMPLVVRRVVPHGTRVNKGQPILWLDTERLNETIRDLEANLRLGQLSTQILEREIPILKDTIPLGLAAADRSRKEAQEDLDRFVKEDRSFDEKSADENVKFSRFLVEFAEEEMRQLEKIYKADELVEDTERIILRRQQMYIDLYKMSLALDEKRRRDLLQYELPRKDVSLRERLQKLALDDAKARATLSLSLERKQLELEKTRLDAEKSEQRLAKLRRDRQILENITSPMDGYVYYGRFEYGQWVGFDEAKNLLVSGNAILPNKTLLTIVGPRASHLTALIDEKDLQHVQAGTKARITPLARSDLRLDGEVQRVTAYPSAPGKFLVRVTLANAREPALVPGTQADIRIVSYFQEVALTLPSEVVQTDERDDSRHFVEVRSEDGRKVRRYITVGKNNGRRVEVLNGVVEGQKVLVPKATEKSTEMPK